MSLIHTQDADLKNQTAVGASNPLPVTASGAAALPVSLDQGTPWASAAASGGLTGTTDQVLSAARGAGIVNYLTSLDIYNVHATVSTEVVIKDGSTIIWRGFAKAVGVNQISLQFLSPLRSSANAALNAACLTTGTQTYVNAQGYYK